MIHPRNLYLLLGVLLIAAVPIPAADEFDQTIASAKTDMLTDPSAARRMAEYAGELVSRAPTRNKELRLATAEWLQGEAALRMGDLNSAGPLIDRALARLDPRQPSKLYGDLLMARGALHAAIAQVAAALTDYQRAHEIYRRLKELRSQSLALVTIGTMYNEAADYENALKYYNRSRDAYAGDPSLSLSTVINQAIALGNLRRYSASERLFTQALRLARKLKSPLHEAKIFRNLARLAVDRKDYVAADQAVARGMTVARTGDELRTTKPQFDAIAAEIAFRRGQLGRARQLIENAFVGTDLTQTDLSLREAHYTAYAIYSKLNNVPLALAHLRAMKRLDDQTWKLTASTNTALMAAKFDSAYQEAQISKLQAEDAARKLAMEQAQTRFERTLFAAIAAAAAIVLGLLAAGLFQSRRARVRLSASNVALEKALAAKTEFLATTSHEIRTPLNGILGMTQVMLADPKLDAALKDRVGIVQAAGLTMRGLVDDILDVAKMETGNLTIEAQPFDLKAMLADVTRMWGEQARAKGLEFRLDLGDCPRGIVGDAGRVRQVVYNLLSNAVKFTATGSVTVRASCGGDRLRIVVSDTGIGIAPDKHAEIFESFKQADGGTTRQFGGTGLGLAIVRNIATAMQGAVSVASAPGAGATFTVELPFVVADLPREEAAPEAGGLLIVERNPIARAMLKAVLEPRAGRVVFANSCAEAVPLLGEVARVLVDQATAAADDADPVAAVAALAAAGVPVAVLWSNADDAARGMLAAAGVGPVVAKPIAGPALAAALYAGNTHEALVTQAA